LDIAEKEKMLTVALVGNPNSGKTVIFNNLTGSRQHVGNWPGVTVEKKEGILSYNKKQIKVIDLPGIYGLDAQSEDEIISRDYLLFNKPDVVINIIDSGNLERNLYLTTQLLEMGLNVIIALNMIDECKTKKIDINIGKVSKKLKVPVVATIATKRTGMRELLQKVEEHIDNSSVHTLKIKYCPEINNSLDCLETMIKDYMQDTYSFPARWVAVKLMEGDFKTVNQIIKTPPAIVINKRNEMIEEIENSYGEDVFFLMADSRYDFIKKLIKTSVTYKDKLKNNVSFSDKLDKIVTHKILGIPIFLLVMFGIFALTFRIGDPLAELLKTFLEWFSEAATTFLMNIGTHPLIVSLITDGIIGGLGSVLVFLPNILLLFLAISLLEDSGYMARAAYVIDRFMHILGLHGKAFIPLLIGFGCNVPGVMATRTLENRNDRLTTILISPLMSCSAKLPIYILFANVFFKSYQTLIVFSLYVLGIILAIFMAFILKRFVLKSEKSFFIMELPPYRIPTLKSTFLHMWRKSSSFIKKAGTIIITAVIIIWALSNLPIGVEYGSKDSLLGQIGSFVAPVLRPAGFGTWEASAALIFGIVAKEAVIGSLGVIYGVDKAGLGNAISRHWTPLSAYSFMIMTLLYIPCIAVIGVIRRETNSWGWTFFSIAYSLVLGWGISVLFYQIAHLFAD